MRNQHYSDFHNNDPYQVHKNSTTLRHDKMGVQKWQYHSTIMDIVYTALGQGRFRQLCGSTVDTILLLWHEGQDQRRTK